jgi:hypothetical protein
MKKLTFLKSILASVILVGLLCVLSSNVSAQNVTWKYNFGGDQDVFTSVTNISDGVVAVGTSHYSSFGQGDWGGYSTKGYCNATIVKFDNIGNIVWKNYLGGRTPSLYIEDHDYFLSVTTVSDGIIAVGKIRSCARHELGIFKWNNFFWH